MPTLTIDTLTAQLPIIQGGMGVGVSLSGLSSAVAKQGCIGVIATAGIGMMEPDFMTNLKEANHRALIREVKTAKKTSNGIIGVNIMIALTDHASLLDAALEAGADLIFMSAGLPLKIPRMLADFGRKDAFRRIVPVVSSARAADVILRSWAKFDAVPGAFVVEGPLAGGHLGFKKDQIADPQYALENLVPDVLSVVNAVAERYSQPIPVIAAGGIYTGTDIRNTLQMGVSGVQMATRFVATHECDADIRFKEAYVKAGKEDLVIIDSPVGLPGRALRNRFLEDVTKGEKHPVTCPWKCLRTCDFKNAPYCIGLALTNAKQGNIDQGFVFSGANSWRVESIVSVKDLIDGLKNEYAQNA